MFYIVLFFPRLFTLVIHSGFDYKCVVFEKAHILNCTQEFLVPRPEHWILSWLANSIVSSVTLIFIVWLNQKQLNYSFASLKRLYKKGSFWSLNFLYLITCVYHTIRINGTDDEIDMVTCVLLLFSPAVTLFVVYFLNYLHPVKFPSRKRRNVDTVCTFLMYWLTLVIYCAENACLVLTVMLDAALEVAPLVQGKYQEDATELNGFVLILLGINVAFRARLLAFFWNKIFHGDRDLMSEPTTKLDINRPCRRHTM